ncbi:SDR family oxidoreductase [Demequina sp. NBRC 110052]|uniref:SDR family NAD(P)-dependent oxidoreductase n=1 Tax=Demequina sp. NBRC 110052 TaxID=1570341 RepID=UPI000A06CBF7|nr:SDR family oxidoreductase [Demequina sp. NBRC 110052]
MTPAPSCAVVTGASSGLGAEFARRLAALGTDVVLVARRMDRLAVLAERLQATHGIRATPIEVDLAQDGASQRLVQELERRSIAPDGLVNCAGFGVDGPFAEHDPDVVRSLLAVNVVALTELSRLLLPQIMASGRGVLVNVASTASYQPLPSIALYAASKAYVRSLTEALWKEAEGTGARILAFSPGPTETEFFAVAGSERFKVGQVLSIEQVVDVAFRELARAKPGPSRIAGVRNVLTAFAPRLVPTRVSLDVASRLTAR